MAVDIDIGAEVWSSDGKRIGTVAGVVVDPYEDEATDVVIVRGTVVPERKVVPIRYVHEVRDHRLVLTLKEPELEHQPDLDERVFMPLDVPSPEAAGEPVPPHTWTPYPDVALPPLLTWGDARRPHVELAWRNVPDVEEVLREGLPVRTRDGQMAGVVDELVTDPQTGVVTHLVIRRGPTHAGDKAVPIEWVERTDEESGVTLAVGRRAVDELPDYH